jgi:hypothetical protein
MRSDAAMRWSMVGPGALIAWCVLGIVTMAVHGQVEQAYCEPDNYSAGMCYGVEADDELQVVMNAFMAISALLVESIAVAIAPSDKRNVAIASFVAASALAYVYGVVLGNAANTAYAVGAGLIGLVIIESRLRLDSRA